MHIHVFLVASQAWFLISTVHTFIAHTGTKQFYNKTKQTKNVSNIYINSLIVFAKYIYHFILITLLFLRDKLRPLMSITDSTDLTLSRDFREAVDRSELTEVDRLRGGT